jgi:hypothetical protein
MTTDEITNLVTALGDLMQVLRDADPADKAEIYNRLGLTLTYDPQKRLVTAQSRPEMFMYVGKCPRLDTHLTYMIDIALTAEFSLAVGGAS